MKTAVAILLGLFASWPIARHCDLENLGRGVERPDLYTAAMLTSQGLMLKFELGRVPGYSHPYGFAESVGPTAWAQIDLKSAVWTSIDDVDLGRFNRAVTCRPLEFVMTWILFSPSYGLESPLS